MARTRQREIARRAREFREITPDIMRHMDVVNDAIGRTLLNRLLHQGANPSDETIQRIREALETRAE